MNLVSTLDLESKMAFDSPIGYTSHYNFPKYALGTNPGADALNSFFESLDTHIYDAFQNGGNVTYTLPLVNTVGVVKLDYTDSFKITTNKLDTVQDIKTTATPQFSKLALGGVVDVNFGLTVYTDAKFLTNVTITGDLNLLGKINQVTVNDLDVADHVIRLNKDGDDTTALNGGLHILGASNALKGSITYTGTAWLSDLNLDIATGKVYKINNAEVLSANTLGSSVVYSSLTKVGTITEGAWSGSAILPAKIATDSSNRFVTDTQISDWGTAFSNTHSHSNKTLLDSYGQTEVNLADAVSKKHSHSNIANLDAINQSLATTSTPAFAGGTYNGNLNTQSIIPLVTDSYDLGTYSKYFSNLFISNIQATVFAENTISAVGGWLFITKGQGTLPAVSNSATVIDFGQTMTANDFVKVMAKDSAGNYKTEYIKISSQYSGTAYNVQRDVANAHSTDPSWTDGTAYVILGQNGNGRIELNAYNTPRISVIKQGAAYNAQSELIRLGDLNGMGDYSTEIYGMFVGDYTGNKWLAYDTTNSLRMHGNAIIDGTVKAAQIDVSDLFAQTITATGTITGGTINGATIQTQASGYRVKLDGLRNSIPFMYDDAILSEFSQVTTYGLQLTTDKFFIQNAGLAPATIMCDLTNKALPEIYLSNNNSSRITLKFGSDYPVLEFKKGGVVKTLTVDTTATIPSANWSLALNAPAYLVGGAVGTAGQVLRSNGSTGFVAGNTAIADVTGLQTALDGKSSTSHNHSGIYSAIDHNHSGVYSLSSHDHTGAYSLVNHTHTGNSSEFDIEGSGAITVTNYNYIQLIPFASGYDVSLYGLLPNTWVTVINVSTSYSVTVNTTNGSVLLDTLDAMMVYYDSGHQKTFFIK